MSTMKISSAWLNNYIKERGGLLNIAIRHVVLGWRFILKFENSP
jgi:hypothetical protein